MAREIAHEMVSLADALATRHPELDHSLASLARLDSFGLGVLALRRAAVPNTTFQCFGVRDWVRRVDASELGFVMLVLGAVAAVPAGVMAYIILTDDGALRGFHATARQPIRSALAGDVVKIVGRAGASSTLVGPFSGRDVVWYSVAVTEHERYVEGTQLRERMTRHLAESSREPFTLTDDSDGSARVVVDGEEMFGEKSEHRTDVGMRPLPAQVRQALDERGIATRAEDGQRKRLVCTERAILPGEMVVVIGPARRAPCDADAGSRTMRTELVMGERGPGPKRMFEVTTLPESELGASNRRFARITWALALATALLLGVGGWLVFS